MVKLGLKQDPAPRISGIEETLRGAQRWTHMPDTTITLNVREDIRAGREPFPRIMEAVGRLRDGEQLRVLAPFEPRPLIGVLAAQGFTATITPLDGGDFEIVFSAAAPVESDEQPLL